MYKEFKKLVIKRNSFEIDNNNLDDIVIDTQPIFYNERFFVEKQVLNGKDDDGRRYTIQCYKNNVVISDNEDDLIVAKIYVPQKVKHLIEKDIRRCGEFDLEYRKHLYKEYDRSKHVFVQMNMIPEEFEETLELIREKSKRYSEGFTNPPIVIVYYNDQYYSLIYSILKDHVIVESGELGLDDWLKNSVHGG